MKTSSKDLANAVSADGPTSASSRSPLDFLGVVLGGINWDEKCGASACQADRWEDEKYLYLEATFPPIRILEADISIHGDKIFVRVEK